MVVVSRSTGPDGERYLLFCDGDALRAIRQSAGWSAPKLASQVTAGANDQPIKPRTIYDAEVGLRNPSFAVATKIANILGVPISAFCQVIGPLQQRSRSAAIKANGKDETPPEVESQAGGAATRERVSDA